jgi:anaphase-promoting complex subunit 6
MLACACGWLCMQGQCRHSARALKARSLCGVQAATWAALAYTQQLAGQLAAAIESYHKALGLRQDDSFSNDMLAESLQQECARFSLELISMSAG